MNNEIDFDYLKKDFLDKDEIIFQKEVCKKCKGNGFYEDPELYYLIKCQCSKDQKNSTLELQIKP